ncbi:MAG TPA: tetratricopeptide repeat protein, partial [Labilithrix sp.]
TVELIVPALLALAERDPGRASDVARRALDVLGPRHAALRDAIGVVTKAARDVSLEVRLGERWIAAGAPPAERGPLLLALGRRYAELGDSDRELSAYVRAAREGADLASVRDRLDALAAAELSGDADIAWLEARAEMALDEGRTDLAARTFRELGAALWDAADDRPRAVQAWLRAAQHDTARGYATLRTDLCSFADAQYATDCLAELVDREGDRARAGIIATEAARAALEANAYPRALALAKTALDRHPGHASALETAEVASARIGRVQEMSPIYDQVARRALGRFGRRAAHHRAARFFEASGVNMMALKHAAQAFIAVPSEGSTLALLARTADRANRRSVAVRTLEHVAELARGQSARAAWLLRAASMTARDLDGTRQRVDLLLKTCVLAPSPNTLGMLAGAARDLLSLAPDDAEPLSLRLQRASDSLAKDLEGPDGARIALVFAEMALDLFADAGWAWRAIERATNADGDIEEYTKLAARAADLARAKEAEDTLVRIWQGIEKPYANIGHSLLRLVGAVADARGDQSKRAKALVMAAEKEPEDDELVAEADDAVAKSLDTALLERLSKKVGVFRRSEALRAIAARAVERGDAPASIRFLERAYVIAPGDVKNVISKELRDALVRAGRGEEAVLRDIADEALSRDERAARWAELAKIREERGDKDGAADALLQAASEQSTAERWAAVESAADASGRDHVRVEALQKLVDLVSVEERLPIMKRLARAEAARGSLGAAENAWRGVWTLAQDDAEADVAIEALLIARSSYDELAEHLGRRAARLKEDPESKEQLRAVRLRRAAILEQRLGRLEDAAQELETLLRETPGHASALRWVADLYERMGQPERALPALEELSANDPAEREASGLRRARAMLEAGEATRAHELVRALHEASKEPSLAVLEMRVAVARALQDPNELGAALVDLAKRSQEDPRVRSELLVEAAQSAARAGDTDASLERAREAAKLAPDAASTQLFARGLEYRLRGAGTIEEARSTVAALERLDPLVGLEPEDIALRAFLLAEAQDVIASGSGEATLAECLGQVGRQALVALGLAERAAASGRAGEALSLYEDAVYGNLLGLRRPGLVALAASECSELAGNTEALLRFLNEAAKDPETRTLALRRLGEGSIAARDLSRAKTLLRSLAESLEGAERAEVLAALARALFDSPSPADRIDADRLMRDAIDHASADAAVGLRSELATYRSRAPGPSAAPVALSRPPAEPRIPQPPPMLVAIAETPSPIAEPAAASLRHPLQVTPVEPAPESGETIEEVEAVEEKIPSAPSLDIPKSAPPPPPAPPLPQPSSRTWAPPKETDATSAAVAEAHAKLAAGKSEEAEALLFEALRSGSLEAADALDVMLASDRARTSLLTKVRRMAAELVPGDRDRLVALREAARLDQNGNYVRAIEHVIRAFADPAGPLAPPPLGAQASQPGLLLLLTRHSREPAGEAFACVWEGAQSLFVKPPTAYGMTGLERVVPGPTSPLSRLYEAALRLLDTQRFGLFHRRGPGVLTPTIALLASPSAILSGYAGEDNADLRWVLGHALAGVLPQNAMPLAMIENEGRALWQVLGSAFGPPGRVKVGRENAALAEILWQTLAPRAQRRLKELLASDVETPFELVVERAKQSGRRVGMFLTGDFGHATQRIVSEYRRDVGMLEHPQGLRRLCAELPALADLFRLAIRPEYADARWHVPAPSSSRLSSGHIRAVV